MTWDFPPRADEARGQRASAIETKEPTPLGQFSLFLAASLLLSGCGKSLPATGASPAPSAAEVGGIDARGVDPGATSSNAPSAAGREPFSSVQLTQISNQVAVLVRNQAELVEQLQARIDQLERRELSLSQQSDQARSEERNAFEQRIHDLVGQIAGLQKQVAALQSGRVLPEIALGPDDAPTSQELDQKIRIAERKSELAAEAAEARAKEAPRLSAGPTGFALSSADTNFVLKLRGLLQVDSRVFFNDHPSLQGNDGFLLRRARPILEGTLFGNLDFQLTPDFAGSSAQIFDAWLNYRYRPGLQLRAGKFKGPVGFENLLSDANSLFNERSMVSDLVPTRSLGAQVWGQIGEGTFSYAAGVLNASGDGRNPGAANVTDDVEFAAGLTFEPFKRSGPRGLQGLGLGLAGSYGEIRSNAIALPSTSAASLPGYLTPAGQQFFAYNPVVGQTVAEGVHWRFSPHLFYLYGPFGLLGELGLSQQGVLNNTTLRAADLRHTAWQIAAQYVLTGEPASFAGINPSHPFNPANGRWGAWQFVGRYGRLDVDNDTFPVFANPATSASSATSWSVGANWWLNRNLRLLSSYTHSTFDGGGNVNPFDPSTTLPPATVAARDEDAFLTRLQLAF